ncbi:hypothetical protein A0J61_10519, partial [Choanephora cucurbitarum]
MFVIPKKNGDGSVSSDSTQRQDDFHRPVRCVSAHPNSSFLTPISTLQLAKLTSSVHDYSLWSVGGSISFTKLIKRLLDWVRSRQIRLSMLLGRFDYHRRIRDLGFTTNTIGSTTDAKSEVFSQHKEI